MDEIARKVADGTAWREFCDASSSPSSGPTNKRAGQGARRVRAS